MNKLTEEQMLELKELNNIHTSWKDYSLLLLNSTPEPLRSIWQEKVVTSLLHWGFRFGSMTEGNIIGIEILCLLPDWFTEMVVDDVKHTFNKLDRLKGSKRLNIHLGGYSQEALSNEAALCLKFIVNHWNEKVDRKNTDENIETYKDLIFKNPYLSKMWNFAQKSGGRCLIPDELLTYILEKEYSEEHGSWIDVCEDVFTNGCPSTKYAQYWKTMKDSNFGPMEGYPFAEFVESSKEWYVTTSNPDGSIGHIAELKLEEQKNNFIKVVDIVLKEDLEMSTGWKKIAICILKNDVSFKYAGFAPTYREQEVRQQALGAFSQKQEEKKLAQQEAERLAKQIEKEKLKEI